MERKYLQNLIDWKNDLNRKPLLIIGARQVGKTYLIENLFAKKYYKNSYLKIDCSDDSDFVNYVLKTNNLDKMIDYIKITYDFVPDKDHLLFFDEAQECLPVIRMMKQFCENKREIPVIVSGSLVRISVKRHAESKKENEAHSFLFPVGKINTMTIYPLTFSEFLMNYNQEAYNFIKVQFMNKTNVDIGLHQKLMEYFYDYLFVGGMPEVVDSFISYKNDKTTAYKIVVKKLKDIYSNYLNDMDLYQASPESIVRSRSIYRSIYSQLNKENKNFKYSNVEKNMRNRDALNPMEWLILTDVIIKCDLLKEKVTSPLIESEETLFRLYLSDMGLFTYQSELEAKTFFLSKENVLSGIYFENYIASELHSHNRKLFYWKGKRNSEFEFLLDINNRIIPIDSKKAKGSLNSLNEFREHNKKDLVIKVSQNQFGYDNKQDILTLPYYYLSFLLDELENNYDALFDLITDEKRIDK